MYLEIKGIKLPDNDKIISPRVRDSIVAQRYEAKESAQIEKLCQKGDRILEIGTGLGFISTLCSKHPNVSSVVTYEADPNLTDFIKLVHQVNDASKVKAYNAALTNDVSKKTMPFYVRKNFWGSSFTKEAGAFEKTIDVPLVSFNKVIDEYRPTFIICDIEGAELDVFLNGNLTGVDRVLVEIHQSVLGRAGIKKLFDAMSAKNFHYDQFHSNQSVVLFSHISRPHQ